MAGFLTLLRCVGRAVHAKGLRSLLSAVPFGEALYDISTQTLEELRKEKASVADQITSAASASSDEVRQLAEQVAREIAPNNPAEQKALALYLSQVPNAIRRSLMRPSDPTGRTLPAGFQVNQPQQLLPFLPHRMPRYRAGDRWPGRTDWQLVELLGMGGFGEVWKAHNPHTNQTVAVKFCLDAANANDLRNDVRLQQRLARERQNIANIVPLLDTNLNGDPPSLTYQFIDGYDLNGLIAEWAKLPNADRVQRSARLVAKLARIIGAVHRLKPEGIVHRDLKPANILVRRGTESDPELWVIDLGIGGLTARQSLGDESRGSVLTMSLRGSHTALYASQQQKEGRDPDPRDDVHAIGVIWYQLVTGQTTEGPGIEFAEELAAQGVTGKWADLLRRSVNKRAEKRSLDGTAMAEEMGRLLKPSKLLRAFMACALVGLAVLLGWLFIGDSINVPEHIRNPGSQPFTNSIGMELVWITPGTFMMGSPDSDSEAFDDEKPQHEVTLTKGYHLGKYEVTRGQFAQFVKATGHKTKYDWQNPGFAQSDDHPVANVSWDDALAFCRWLSKQEGCEYRLPTEAEWEYACRAGTTTPRYNGRGVEAVDQIAWFVGNSGNATHSVGKRQANAWGLYDMQGNVWEWCSDYRIGKYQVIKCTDPKGPTEGTDRVNRGGGWHFVARYCRSASRDGSDPSYASSSFGFRLARSSKQ